MKLNFSHFIASRKVKEKLISRHDVSLFEVRDALNDRRQQQTLIGKAKRGKERTYYVVAKTTIGRYLRIIMIVKDGNPYLKTAFDADENDIRAYQKGGK